MDEGLKIYLLALIFLIVLFLYGWQVKKQMNETSEEEDDLDK